jgi:hypothetical protein
MGEKNVSLQGAGDYIQQDSRTTGGLRPQPADLTMQIKDGEVQLRLLRWSDVHAAHFCATFTPSPGMQC